MQKGAVDLEFWSIYKKNIAEEDNLHIWQIYRGHQITATAVDEE